MELGCYYFPNYHPGDRRNAEFHGPGWSEWEVVRNAVPRWPGHRQPKIPVWGYGDESDPAVMAKKISAAQTAGIDCFIFDAYFYPDGPFLEDCLDKGFLPAVKKTDFRFALMWANHDWLDIHPCCGTERNLLYDGHVDPEEFRRITDGIIEKYLCHPNYYRLNGKPYFSIYHLQELIDGLGGFTAAKKALLDFRKRAEQAGLPGVHLNAVIWGSAVLPGEGKMENREAVIEGLGFDSIASYVWVHHMTLPQQREMPYPEAMKRYHQAWDEIESRNRLPYYPNVTVGWDSSPRTRPDKPWDPSYGYPYSCTLSENTPENFRKALAAMRERMEQRKIPFGTINCWNEWTEGSMLEPEQEFGMGYLEAVKTVFGEKE